VIPAGHGHKSIPSRPDITQSLLASAASYYGLDAGLLNRLAWVESGYNQAAISPKGALGVMQLMNETARDLGVDRRDLAQNIFGGAAYLRLMLDRYGGDSTLALAAYNAGPGKVDRLGGAPFYRETQTYLRTILGEAYPKSKLGAVIFQSDQ
jgi:soluble lytic murein transglycosylase-like protein